MRNSSIVAIVAGVAFVLSTLPAGSTTFRPRVAGGIAQRRIVPSSTFRTSRGRSTIGAPCTVNASAYFIGVPGQGNIAGGAASSVTSGVDNVACEADSGIVAGQDNTIATDSNTMIANSFIGAGESNSTDAADSFIGAGYANSVTGADAFVGAGIDNYAEGAGSFIGAGGTQFYGATGSTAPDNIASGQDAAIGAGDANVAAGNLSFIGAGQTNTVTAAGSYSSIVGGNFNTVSGAYSAILGGNQNTASGEYSSITGGNRNSASGEYSDVVGGFGNSATGLYAIVIGGDTNLAAGNLSLAGGYHARAVHSGSFVWSDYVAGSQPLSDTAPNQFVARASGGVYFYSNEMETAGVELTSGSGTWASVSDRNAKTNIVPVDDTSVLTKLAALPVSIWSYKSEHGVRHLGPMAQDFYAAFGVGADDRHITSIDEDGVALAAIKALSVDARRKDAEYLANGNEISALQREMRDVEVTLASERAARLTAAERGR
jgi:hypothetical protein